MNCHHCGGVMRLDGIFSAELGQEIYFCLLCGRESGHLCDVCLHPPASMEETPMPKAEEAGALC